ncbi:hypothetical protein [Clavibacter tessellarius]|uniref:hypothetical protein n=1 Tax=Clavibacter tessellarius TaxID=31965 RepID=UPI0032536FDA
MIDWHGFDIGETRDLTDGEQTIRVRRDQQDVFEVLRVLENRWQPVVWVKQAGIEWRVSRQKHVIGITSPDLNSAMLEGIYRSREALK